MATLLEVILPVFLVIGFGYVAVWKGLFSESGVDGLMVFTQQFAIPCLLFRAMSTLDLGANFSLKLMLVYYVPALSVFALGIVGARILFNRPWTDSVAIGFCCLFANMALLGLPISEKAFGPDSLSTNYALLSIHTPICYGLGITLMEIVRAESGSAVAVAGSVLKAMFRNALILGIAAGMAVNLSGVALPTFFIDGVDLMVSAALPAALFGLGGVLYQYRPEGDMLTILFVIALVLLLRPLLILMAGTVASLDPMVLRSAILTGAMAPGVNIYVFANMYGVARRVAASAVLVATAMSILTLWAWLAVLS